VVSEAHGQAPFSTLEGLIVHLADSADARFSEFIQGVLLSKLRDVEKEGCSVYKALDELVKKKGLKTTVQLMLQSIDKLVEEAKKLCKLQTE
jgi:7,8-dihydroneopterin 2',3'-cyclic phosphate phosphodiesterase